VNRSVWDGSDVGKTHNVEPRLTLHPDPVEVATARRFVAETLTRWRANHDRDTALLLVSELVTNAVVHARTNITVTIRCEGQLLTVEVRDGSDQIPVRRDNPTTTLTDGRGLNLIAELSDDWGIRQTPGHGKVVWFSLSADEASVA
jgi:anti-sigma regulatory factor (Ser/Thr protein kinase)